MMSKLWLVVAYAVVISTLGALGAFVVVMMGWATILVGGACGLLVLSFVRVFDHFVEIADRKGEH